MAEREDTGFKVTDRRKDNPDGSPRESAESEVENVAAEIEAEAEPPTQSREPAANNVLSFPGEPAKKQPEPEPKVASEPEPRAAASAPTAPQGAWGHAEQAYNQAKGPNSTRL